MSGNSNMFHMEVFVYCVRLFDPDQASNTCPVCVGFRFPDIVDLEIGEDDLCGKTDGGGNVICMTRGKSCLFAVDSSNVCRAVRQFYADIGVFRRVTGTPESRLVAQARLQFSRTFTDIIEAPDQPDQTREMKRTLNLYEMDRPNPVGTMEVYVRLTSQGTLIVTEFIQDQNTKKFQYKGLNDYVSGGKGKPNKTCSERGNDKCCCRKKSHKNKVCRKEAEQAGRTGGRISGCSVNTRQVEVLLDAMGMMKTLYERASKMPVDGDAETVPCAFDANCPIAGCPFRWSEPPPPPPPDKSTGGDEHCASRDTGHHRAAPSGKSPKTVVGYVHPKPPPPVDKSIVDDADLFVVGVGREDPCRIREPVPRLAGTQYLYSDISASFLPAPAPEPEPVPVPEPKKKGKKAKKDKHSKKGKTDVKKKKKK